MPVIDSPGMRCAQAPGYELGARLWRASGAKGAESEKWRYANRNQPLIRAIVLSNLATLQYPHPLIRLQP